MTLLIAVMNANALNRIPFDVRDAIARAEALTAARESADFAAISAAFKRIKNILRQGRREKVRHRLTEEREARTRSRTTRRSRFQPLHPKSPHSAISATYAEALALIATLRPAVDTFFDKVMVLDSDETVRGAHLGLISEVQSSFSGIADFSEIVTA